MNAIVQSPSRGDIIETVMLKGDLGKLTPQERSDYYLAICQSVGLNPLTRPFEYITLNGKLTLYARKDCTDQLRSIHNISVEDMTETEREGVFIVTTKVQNAAGRRDIAKGAVNIQGLKGENLANALMKAETKSKRRATLAICGLGLLDETEVEDASFARPAPQATAQPVTSRPVIPSPDADLDPGSEPDGQDDEVRLSFLSTIDQKIKDWPAADFEGLKTWWLSAEQKQARAFFDVTQAEIDVLKALIASRRTQTAPIVPAATTVAPKAENAPASPYEAGEEACGMLEGRYTDGVEALETFLWSLKGKSPEAIDAAWEATIGQLPGDMLLPPDLRSLQGVRARLAR